MCMFGIPAKSRVVFTVSCRMGYYNLHAVSLLNFGSLTLMHTSILIAHYYGPKLISAAHSGVGKDQGSHTTDIILGTP